MVDFKKIMRQSNAERQAARDAADAAFKAAWIVKATQRCDDVRRLAGHFDQMTVWERRFMSSLIAKLDQIDDSGWCVGGKLSELSDLQVKALNGILSRFPTDAAEEPEQEPSADNGSEFKESQPDPRGPFAMHRMAPFN